MANDTMAGNRWIHKWLGSFWYYVDADGKVLSKVYKYAGVWYGGTYEFATRQQAMASVGQHFRRAHGK